MSCEMKVTPDRLKSSGLCQEDKQRYQSKSGQKYIYSDLPFVITFSFPLINVS